MVTTTANPYTNDVITSFMEQTFGKTALNKVKNHLEANVEVANPWALKWFASSDECSLIN